MADNTKRRKRVSKKNKKSWRKHTDIADVEEFLEDLKLQERIGDPSLKPDESLFVWDISKAIKKSGKRGKEPKPLRCHQHLQPDPLTTPARIIRRVPVIAGKKKTARILDKEKRLFQSATMKIALQQREKELEKKRLKKFQYTNTVASNHDLWTTTESNPEKPITEDIDSDQLDYYLETTKQKLMLPPKYKEKKPNDLAAVEVLHPGGSYNPTFDDYMVLMSVAHQVEKKKMEEAKKISRQLKPARIRKEDLKKAHDEEMKSGLFDEEDKESEVEENIPDISAPAVRRDNRKTAQKRRRELISKIVVQHKKEEKAKKLRENQIFSLRSIKRQLNAEEQKTEARIKKKKERKKKKRLETTKLGRHKFEAPDIPVLLSYELPGNLRRLRPQGQLLMDRYKSLQQRNIIETRFKQKKRRRYPLKYVETRKHQSIIL